MDLVIYLKIRSCTNRKFHLVRFSITAFTVTLFDTVVYLYPKKITKCNTKELLLDDKYLSVSLSNKLDFVFIWKLPKLRATGETGAIPPNRFDSAILREAKITCY